MGANNAKGGSPYSGASTKTSANNAEGGSSYSVPDAVDDRIEAGSVAAEVAEEPSAGMQGSRVTAVVTTAGGPRELPGVVAADREGPPRIPDEIANIPDPGASVTAFAVALHSHGPDIVEIGPADLAAPDLAVVDRVGGDLTGAHLVGADL